MQILEDLVASYSMMGPSKQHETWIGTITNIKNIKHTVHLPNTYKLC